MHFRPWIGLSLLLLLLAAAGCRPAAPSEDPLAYFPDRRALRKGIVNKYYLHYAGADGFERTTDIRYHQYRLTADDRLRVTVYGPDCRPREQSEYRFSGSRMELLAHQYLGRADTLRAKIVASTVLDWARDSAYFLATFAYENGGTASNEARQTAARDTTIENRTARIFRRDGYDTYASATEPAEHIDTVIRVETYAAGLGLFASENRSVKGRSWLELTEQMPYDRFAALAGKVPELVGYIDPRKTIDRGADFELCASATGDYPFFMGRAETHYRGGKRSLRDTVTARLDTVLLAQTSGYLTFRFMIDCRGETGHFVTDQADLDFGIKTFSEATVRHLYDIIRTLPGWEPATPRGQPRDTYTYLTFKFRDGTLVDLLP